uniref:Uncharacterized protein n=1 Tax=Anguilla anguilla TaxID=7936 RepID=A0A0E9VFL5_ANGAN
MKRKVSHPNLLRVTTGNLQTFFVYSITSWILRRPSFPSNYSVRMFSCSSSNLM